MRSIIAPLSSVLAMTLSGCGWNFIADRTSNPAIEENFGSVNGSHMSALLMDAGRRTALVRNTDTIKLFCAEPPPDVVQTYANALQIGLKDKETDASLARTLATNAAPLLYRSQGLQLHRDVTYGMCQDYMNGLYTDNPKEYLAKKEQYFEKSIELIKAEIPLLEKIVDKWRPVAVGAPIVTPVPEPKNEKPTKEGS